MSKIYPKESGAEKAREYTLRDILRPEEREELKKKAEFVPDNKETGGKEFIPGGFDFEYEGGLRRDEILRRSMDEAEEIVRKAREEAEQIQREARAQGFEQGRNEGYNTGMREAATIVDAFTKLVEELSRIREDFYRNAEEEMIHLVVSIARVVIGRDVERNPSLVRNIIDKAIEQVQSREELDIKINPEDLAEAEQFRPELAKKVMDIDKVSFKGDPLITRGGCMVESNIGSIDARLETQLESVRESFLQALRESVAEGGSRKPDEQG